MTAEYPEEGQSPWGEDLKDYIDAADTDTRNYVDTQVEDLLQPRDNDGNLRFINGDALSDGGAIVHEYASGAGRQYAWRVSDDDLALFLATRSNEDGIENTVVEFYLLGPGDKASMFVSEIYAPKIGLGVTRFWTSGTGSPEGVVTADVGSRYTDTAATNGAVEWIKASGTGNTGWKVAYGDTGWRDIAVSGAVAGFTVLGARIRRVGNTVSIANLVLRRDDGLATGADAFNVPTGFQPDQVYHARSYWGFPFYVAFDKVHPSEFISGAAFDYYALTYLTNDAWPTSLPGTAV